MTLASNLESSNAAPLTLERIRRERDQLLLLHEALADVERARTSEDRLRVLSQSICRLGYGRVQTIHDYVMPVDARVVSWISKSAYLDSNDLIVPMRAVDGTTVATLVIGEPVDSAPPPLTMVRTVELFAQHVASIIENARLYDDERRARDAVALSEARYTHLFESASDGIFTVDPNGVLTSVNRSLERGCARPRSSLLGTPVVAVVDPRDAETITEALRETLRGRRRRIEIQYIGPHAESRRCSLTLTPIRDGDVVTGALGVVRDVTDERRLTEQLVQQEKLAAVGQLVSGVAHELNNPLASVTAFAQLLLAAPPGGPHDRGALEAISQESKRASKIVSNLLTFARQHQPERRVTDLNQVIEDTLELRRYALRIAHIEVETSLDVELPLTWADSFQLQQVVLNLFVNAEQALASWSGDRRIEVATAWLNKQLVIRVQDSGPGVAPEHLNRIFNPFFTTKPVGEGTGLGLSISDGIAREHGGRIRVETQPGAGATFVVEIPYVAPPVREQPIEARIETPRTPRRRILFVDDEAALRHAVTTYFRSLGHVLDAVATGREALARLSTFEYDAVLLDLRLPDIGGDEVLRQIRHTSREPSRVVFLTGDTQSESARAVLAASGHPTVSKPFQLDELAAIVLAERAAPTLSFA